jgi:glucosyl-3-phosphoglycerate synthase
MDYTQERVATLHDFGEADPPALLGETTVVVPVTEREYGTLAAERVFEGLAAADPARVLVPLRAAPAHAPAVADWLDGFDADVEVAWLHGPRVTDCLADAGVDGGTGKGRDVWLALGLLETPYVALQDADAAAFEAGDVRRLCHPLDHGYEFVKAYYARVEAGHLYGRLFRLFYAPLVAALAECRDDPLIAYLGAFRYALAGESAMTADLARTLRPQRTWGLEVGMLADAFREAGFGASAQTDLGFYAHEHRAVSGPASLTDMSEGVGAALFTALAERGIEVDYGALRGRYRAVADRYVRAYAADARFNGLSQDAAAEREQVGAYASAITAPEADSRLPAWASDPLDPAALRRAASADLAAARETQG